MHYNTTYTRHYFLFLSCNSCCEGNVACITVFSSQRPNVTSVAPHSDFWHWFFSFSFRAFSAFIKANHIHHAPCAPIGLQKSSLFSIQPSLRCCLWGAKRLVGVGAVDENPREGLTCYDAVQIEMLTSKALWLLQAPEVRWWPLASVQKLRE